MQLKAARKVVICEQPHNKTASGLVIPGDKDTKEPELGVVVEIGEGKLPVPVEVGDTIVYRRYTDNRITISSKQYNFISFKDIMAVVKDIT